MDNASFSEWMSNHFSSRQCARRTARKTGRRKHKQSASGIRSPPRRVAMIISAATDYRKAAARKLPPFLFHYIDGGSYSEHTLKRNTADLADLALRQRILRNVSDLDTSTELFGRKLAFPAAPASVGLTGMYARRSELLAARSASRQGIPFTLPTLSLCRTP